MIKVVCVSVQLLKLNSERSNQHFNSFPATQRRILCDRDLTTSHKLTGDNFHMHNSSPRDYKMSMRNSSPRGLQMHMRKLTPCGSITYENGVHFKIKSFPSLRLSSFIVSKILSRYL